MMGRALSGCLRSTRRLAACGLFAALALAALPPAAPAAANHPFLSASSPVYEDACGLAFGPGGLYVSDYYHNKIEGPSSIANEAPHGGPCKLAFDSGGDLFVNNWHQDVVEFTPAEIPNGPGVVIDPEPSATERPTGLAVDRETGALYAAHRTYIARYEAPVHAGEAPTRIGEGHLGEAYGVAVSEYPETNGYLYVPDAATRTVKVFNPATSLTTPIATITGEATPLGGFKDLTDSEALVDNNPTSPSYGHLYVLDRIGKSPTGTPQDAFDEFNAEGDYRGQVKGFEDAEPSGIAIEASTGNVYVTSGNSEGSAVFEYGPTAAALKLTATKTGTGGGTVRSSPVGIACGGACAAEYNLEESVTLLASPDSHSDFTGWSVSGPGAQPCPGTGSCTERLLYGDVEVSAKFEPAPLEKLEVSLTGQGTVSSEPAGIHCSSGTCSEEFAEGRLVVLRATPAAHSKVSAWSGCDSTPSPTECRVTMSAARAVSVSFEPIPQLPLGVTLAGTGSGEVRSFPAGISCPGSCSAPFDEGAAVTLTASPDPGSEFGGWSGACSGTAAVCTVTMAEALSVGAEFDPPSSSSPPLPPGFPASPPPSPNVPPPAPRSAEFTLGSPIFNLAGTAATVKVLLPSPGVLTASGRWLKPASVRVEVAGSASLRLVLSAAGRKALRRAPHHELKVRVTFTLEPSGGEAPSALTRALHFRPLGSQEGGQSQITQKGDLFASFKGGISPGALPRHRQVPIAISVSGTVRSLSRSKPPALRSIVIEFNRAGRLDTRGLPTCRLSQLEAASDRQALASCRSALVGRGSYVAGSAFPEQLDFPSQGTILAFNGLSGGRRVVLAHVYGTEPVPVTRIIVFHLTRAHGPFGLVLDGALPPTVNRYGYLKSISLSLHRVFRYRGRLHSYLSAACAAPAGFSSAAFPLAHASLSFEDGRTLEATLTRSCRVAR